jgi:hypothetical protein
MARRARERAQDHTATAKEWEALEEWRRFRRGHPEIKPNPNWPGEMGRGADTNHVESVDPDGDPLVRETLRRYGGGAKSPGATIDLSLGGPQARGPGANRPA